MLAWLVGLCLVAATCLPAWASAEPRLEIRGAAVSVVIIPEQRSNIVVTLVRGNPRLPLKISQFGDTTFVDGALGHAVRGCPLIAGQRGVRIRGLGEIAGASLPRLVVHTPLNVRVVAGGGVDGVVGRSDSLDLLNRGCGRWTIGNVSGRLRLGQIGSGEVRVGASGLADLNVAGGGLVTTRAVRGPLTAVSSGDGAILVESAAGATVLRIAGSGSIGVRSGMAKRLNVSIAGSGAARFGGVAETLTASVTGGGYISVADVTGQVSRRVFGPGEILVGRRHPQLWRR